MKISISAAFSVKVSMRYRYARMQLIYGYCDKWSDYWYNT